MKPRTDFGAHSDWYLQEGKRGEVSIEKKAGSDGDGSFAAARQRKERKTHMGTRQEMI